ncbi:FER1L6, partial [Symbiodinium sp. KB8]
MPRPIFANKCIVKTETVALPQSEKACLLMGPDVNFFMKSDMQKPLKIKWKDYCFRAKIYQAVNLPAKDEEGSSDPLVAINFGSAVLRTQIISQCINPSWNQILE